MQELYYIILYYIILYYIILYYIILYYIILYYIILYYIILYRERDILKSKTRKQERMRIVLDADQGVMISVYIYDGYSINPQSMYCVGFDDDKKKKLLYYM
jgi:hypothetical protein